MLQHDETLSLCSGEDFVTQSITEVSLVSTLQGLPSLRTLSTHRRMTKSKHTDVSKLDTLAKEPSDA